ncbi:hypothetical protein [Streptomyces sp. NPDC087300]|uniref:hypothetical protein n=1 Tax=Streptomyces sp. NPDC087300 TaxID=3365780 RepID=UPI0038217083
MTIQELFSSPSISWFSSNRPTASTASTVCSAYLPLMGTTAIASKAMSSSPVPSRVVVLSGTLGAPSNMKAPRFTQRFLPPPPVFFWSMIRFRVPLAVSISYFA